MPNTLPRTKMLLMEDFRRGATTPDVDDLRKKLSGLPGFSGVELTPNGLSTVAVSVPARNQRESDQLKALVNEQVEGWKVIEEQSYELPKTF